MANHGSTGSQSHGCADHKGTYDSRIKGSIALTIICLFILIRGSLPRPRYDQLMASGWKVMLPLALANLVVTGFAVLWHAGGGTP